LKHFTLSETITNPTLRKSYVKWNILR